MLKAQILSVGTEILLGNIVNTNSWYLSNELALLGVGVYRHVTVGDNPDRLKQAVSDAFEEADMLITTGGLGPTQDDLTKETICEYFGMEPVLHEPSWNQLNAFFKRIGRPMVDSNKKQALFPAQALVLANPNGTAPGCILEKDGKIAVMLPGPPREMKPMFENHVKPFLEKRQDFTLYSRTLRLLGIGESAMEKKIVDLIDMQSNPTIAPYAKDYDVTIRITARAESEDDALELINPCADKIYDRLGDYIYGEDDDSIEKVIAEKLIKNSLKMVTAESCSGGLIAARMINYPGISEVFLEGIVSYANESKMRRLGVLAETLDTYGAVSTQTASEMALGAAKSCGADVALSTTGIAGPGGGTPEKPIGLVYMGIYLKGEVITKEFRFPGSRQRVRSLSMMYGLNWLRMELQNRGL